MVLILLQIKYNSCCHCMDSSMSVNFQFLQKTHFKSPRSGTHHLFANIKSNFNNVLR